jgi:hypothetical protein
VSIGTSTRKGLLLTAYGLLILIGLALVYFALRGKFSLTAGVLLQIAYIVVIALLVRFQMRTSPKGQQPSSFHLGIRLPDFVKALLCFVIALLWTGVVGSMAGNSTIGNAMTVGPPVVILIIGAFFIYRSFPKWFRK